MHRTLNLRQFLLLLLLLAPELAAAPAFHVVKAAQQGLPLLANGDFEQLNENRPTAWNPAPDGCGLAAGQGRNGSVALTGSNQTSTNWSGARQTIHLNRTEIAPVAVRGWSKAHLVSGSADSGYSLYVDIVYADDTPLWGQTANFPTGTHDWVQRQVLIIPQKPVKSLTLNCILRGHSGTAFFDDVTVEELKPQGTTVFFQGVPVVPAAPVSGSRAKATTVKTADGLVLRVRDAAVELKSARPSSGAPSGFLVRDVAADSDFYTFENGRCEELGLTLSAQFASAGAGADHVAVSGRIADATGKDRALTLVFALALEARDWHWGDDVRRRRRIFGNGDFANVTSVPCGNGALSLYPVAAVSGDKTGVALGLDMSHPTIYRVGYNSGTRQLYIAYDFGLASETRNFPGAADFRFVLFAFEPEWGFRAAWDKYMRIFPEHFRVRSREQGIWMPFTDVSTVEGWQDFGFKYHEGNNNVRWDDEHGVLSFRYTEPMTWWMRLDKGLPRTFAEALRVRNELAESGSGSTKAMAQVSKIAGMVDESGQPALLFRNEPWCDGAVWSINPNPYLEQPRGDNKLNGGTVHWNPSIKESLYGARAQGQADGEYLDSLEGYVTADLNFRREHFVPTTVPLTFALDDQRPALFKGLAVYEFTRWLSTDVRRMGKLMFANGVPYRFGFLCPWLDVLGTETDWVRNGKYSPASDAQMCYWRALSGSKPYLLLMNTDYDAFTPQLVEWYFQQCLFQGMFPSMFSHNASENPYWRNPKWYNRDRPLFRKYQPVIKRVAEAGWQPITYAISGNPEILVERFGPDTGGTNYFTVLNQSTTLQRTILHLDRKALGLRRRATALELLSGAAVEIETASVELAPRQAKVLAVPGWRETR